MDATKSNVTVRATNTTSPHLVQLFLYNIGNLVLLNKDYVNLWESFDFPTDTLLPQQLLTRKIKLVSSRSQTNFSSGFYKLSKSNRYDNIFSLFFNCPDVCSVYWSWLVFNNSRIGVLNSLGNFTLSDDFTFKSADYGVVLHKRLTLDYDGNNRLYSWEEKGRTWVVSWQAIQRPYWIDGACGANSLCSYVIGSGRKCFCPPGYKMKNCRDWAYGCEPEVDLSCNRSEPGFLRMSHADFYGHDVNISHNYTFDQCRDLCLAECDCKAFQYNFDEYVGFSICYAKIRLLNGYLSPDLNGNIYLKLPKSKILSHTNPAEEFSLNCSSKVLYKALNTMKMIQ